MRQLSRFLSALVIASTCSAFYATSDACAAQIFVSPFGHDTLDGTRNHAVATPKRAQELARASLQRGERTEIVFFSGNYQLDAPLQLNQTDSGSEKNVVVWRAGDNQNVRLSAGRQVRGWQSVKDEAVRTKLDPKVRDRVMQADLKAQGIVDYGEMSGGFGQSGSTGLELFWNDAPMHVSRYPNDGFLQISEALGATPVDVRGTKGTKEGVFRSDDPLLDDARIKRWAQEKDAQLLGYWFWDWADQRQKIAAIDANTRTFTLDKPDHGYGYRKGQYFYAFNLLSEIDAPGEWYLDRERGIAYVLPPDEVVRGAFPRSALVSLLPSALKFQNASHIAFRGFIIEGARDNAVTMNDSKDCSLNACTIRNSGKNAVTIGGGHDCRVVGCDLTGLGDGGVSINGGDRKTLTPGRHVVQNCHIYAYSRWNRTYHPAISLEGVGNRALRNLINDAPHQAMQFSGNDQLIEGNEIHNVCQETNDAGAIYAWNDWAGRGNIVRGNYLYHIYGRAGEGANGVYLDDNFSSALIENNIFESQKRPIHLGGGRDHRVLNNLFVDCKSALHIDARGLGWRAYGKDELTQKLQKWPYQTPPWSKRFPELLTLLNDEPTAPKGIVVARNIFVDSQWDDIESQAKPYVTMRDNLLDATPQVLAGGKIGAGMPRVNQSAPAVKQIGFVPLSYANIGVYQGAKNEARASWPVAHPIENAPENHAQNQISLHPGPPAHAKFIAKAPVIDGVVEANEYGDGEIALAETPSREKISGTPATARLAHDAQNLYIAVTIPFERADKLVLDGDWGAADAAELVLRATKPRGPILVLQGFAGGQKRVSLDAGAPKALSDNLLKATTFAAKIGEKSWTGEWRVPLQVLAGQKTLGFNLGVRRVNSDEWLVWAGTGRQNWWLDGAGILVLD